METTIFNPASLALVLMLRRVKDAARSSTVTWSTVGTAARMGRNRRGVESNWVMIAAGSKANRMPGGFEFHRVKNPIRVLAGRAKPVRRRQAVPGVTLEVDCRAALQRGVGFLRARGVDDGVDIEVAGDVRNQLLAFAAQNIYDTARKIARSQDLREGQRRQGIF